MALYCIGDVQGCDAALQRLLAHIGFSPSRDTVYLLGDLVNRGPDSGAVLRRCMAHEGAIYPLLGNHDLHLLAAAHGARKPSRRDTLDSVLQARDRSALLDWLRQQPLARQHTHRGQVLLMVHAGVLPAWSTADTLALADEVESLLAAMHGYARQFAGAVPLHPLQPIAWRFRRLRRQPHTAAPARAAIELRDHDRVSTTIGNHTEATVPAVAPSEPGAA